MIEYIITIAIVLGAGYWFVRWLRSAASGKGGCSCGTGACSKAAGGDAAGCCHGGAGDKNTEKS